MPEVILRKEAREQGLTKYFTGKPCKNGHLEERNTHSGICYGCSRINSTKYRKTDKGKERLKIGQKKYRQSEKGKEAHRKASSKPNAVKSRKNYQQSEAGKISRKKTTQSESYKTSIKKYQQSESGKNSMSKASKKFLDNNPDYRMARNLRIHIYHQLKGIKAIKQKRFYELVGCDLNSLKKHLEQQFSKNMSWDNYGEWHVDHIVPVAYFIKNFDFSEVEIQQIAYNYSNLHPMWGDENTSKGAKISDKEAEKKIAEIRKMINE